jgi:hypothetical protein
MGFTFDPLFDLAHFAQGDPTIANMGYQIAGVLHPELAQRVPMSNVAGLLQIGSAVSDLAPVGNLALSPLTKIFSRTRPASFVGHFDPLPEAYLAGPYRGAGHHFYRRAGYKLFDFPPFNIKKVFKLPTILSESPFNLMKPNGISIGEFYRRHFLADPSFYSANLPQRVGGGQWVGRRLGLVKPGVPGMLWYGSPRPLKILVGGTAAAAGAGTYEALKPGDPNNAPSNSGVRSRLPRGGATRDRRDRKPVRP